MAQFVLVVRKEAEINHLASAVDNCHIGEICVIPFEGAGINAYNSSIFREQCIRQLVVRSINKSKCIKMLFALSVEEVDVPKLIS